MNTTFAFDLDGVLIIAPPFTQNLEDVYGVPKSESLKFIQGEYQDCVVGKKDLKVILPKYIRRWDIHASVEEIVQFWFNAENKPNSELIKFIQSIRKQGYKCIVATNQEKYRIHYVRVDMHFDEYFDAVISSTYLGTKKPLPEYYAMTAMRLHTDPKDIHFFDDREEYAKSASSTGWHGITYIDNQQVVQEIRKITS